MEHSQVIAGLTIFRQDEEIFQTARNINVGFFATVVLKDYVAAILNTPRANSQWYLDLGAEIKNGNTRVERGTGNVVSVEFAVLYHWHAALSEADGTWMENVFKTKRPNIKSLDELTPKEFGTVLWELNDELFKKPAKEWEFYDMKRGPDGRFDDAKLGELIKNCIDEPAHAFGAHSTPGSMKMVEIMGMAQARNIFNVCTLNEYVPV